MEVSQIPKSFWHAASFCMVVATLGLLYIAYSSSSVSIEIANAKIELSSALSQAKDIKHELANENSRLVEANRLLREKIAKLEKAARSSTGITLKDLRAYGITGGKNSDISKLIREPEKSARWVTDINKKIRSAEQVLKQ